MKLPSFLGAIGAALVAAPLAWAQAPAQPAAPAAQRGATPIFDSVRGRDAIRCGVSQGTPGFSVPGSQGQWTGFDVEFCRALAAAVLGDPNKVRYQPYSAQQRFTALQSGEIDVLSRNTTWTFQRDIQLGLEFVGVAYYDGAGFLARRSPGLERSVQLDGATVCVQTGTTNELIVADFARANRIRLTPLVMQNLEEILQALFSGRCDAFNWDRAALAGTRLRAPNPNDFVLLPEVLSKEPYSPVVAQGDQRWLEIVRWTLFALIEAEENGITQANVDEMLRTPDPQIQRLLGVTGGFGTMMGLSDRWAYNAIKAVGNYGEMFERTLTPMGIDRGVNRLWSRGGLIYAPAMR
ncbi:amino acid ABC transporter substrate-binding protein [Roseomonas sp. CCTCC AB2023176]|uniref:amino acid ABC transporter substrate-binding protein n=1 Tax=Roseomonas sp. CCTCC AB2023176 TaxID=3342640 RepID=UPI0035D72610